MHRTRFSRTRTCIYLNKIMEAESIYGKSKKTRDILSASSDLQELQPQPTPPLLCVDVMAVG